MSTSTKQPPNNTPPVSRSPSRRSGAPDGHAVQSFLTKNAGKEDPKATNENKRRVYARSLRPGRKALCTGPEKILGNTLALMSEAIDYVDVYQAQQLDYVSEETPDEQLQRLGEADLLDKEPEDLVFSVKSKNVRVLMGEKALHRVFEDAHKLANALRRYDEGDLFSGGARSLRKNFRPITEAEEALNEALATF